MNNHIISCRVEINVLKILDEDEDGYPITTGITEIIEKVLNLEVNDNEYESIYNAWLMRENKYYTVNMAEVSGCEWLYHRLLNDKWQRVVDECNRLNFQYTIKNPHLYKIELSNGMLIAPSVWVLSLEPQELDMDYDHISEMANILECLNEHPECEYLEETE